MSPIRRIRLRQSLPASRNHGSVKVMSNFWTRPLLPWLVKEFVSFHGLKDEDLQFFEFDSNFH